jgi:hypothetical protein
VITPADVVIRTRTIGGSFGAAAFCGAAAETVVPKAKARTVSFANRTSHLPTQLEPPIADPPPGETPVRR